MNLWEVFLTAPLTTALLWLYQVLGQNLGWAIIALTVLLRLVLFPLSLPSLRSAHLQREIQPELKKIKEKYKDDRQKLAEAQLALFKEKGINPLAGILPMILQLVLLIALYQVLIANLNNGLNTQFFFWDLSARDPYFVIPILAAGAQFVLSKMMLPAASQEHEAAHRAKAKQEDFASAFARQNLLLFPLFTLLLGTQFPAGLMLYWLLSTASQIPLQWFAMRK